MSPDFLSYSPMIMRSGFKVSWMAAPWRRNSGLMHKLKPMPQGLPLDCSRMGLTTFSVVPGTTVLLTTMRWWDIWFLRASPISWDASLMYWRLMLPSGWLGVPTARNVMSVFVMASLRFVTHFNLFVLMAFSSSCLRLGS